MSERTQEQGEQFSLIELFLLVFAMFGVPVTLALLSS